MNEQQLADLFSNQLDKLLQGQTPVLPPEASDLQGLLDFGQQFSQVTFQPSTAAQAAFQGQLASWFGPTPGGAATMLGMSKTLFFTLIGAAILVGIGVGLTLLDIPSTDNLNGLSAPEVLPLQDSPEPPAVDSGSETTPKTPDSSLEETIPDGGHSSLGDTVPTSPPSLGDTLPLPTPTVTTTVEVDVNTDIGSGEDTTSGTDDGNDDVGGEETQTGDHDKGHGNDADGIDEDNPGNSSGVGGGNDQDQGSDGIGGLDRGNDSGNNQDGEGGGNGGGKGSSNGGAKGKGSGSKNN